MEGTYSNPFAQKQGQSPLTPDTPSGGAYQVNVNRTKTRKWVEAKVQSYDGDDWGADEFDEEDEEPEPQPPPVPRVTTGLRPVGQRLPSETLRSSQRLPAAVSSSSQSASGPPSLHVQTGQSEAEQTPPLVSMVPAHVQDSPRSTPSPVGGRNGSPVPLPSQRPPPAVGHPADARSSTPHSAASSAPARSSPLVRPVEFAQRGEEDRRSTDPPKPVLNVGNVKLAEETTPPKETPAQQYPELELPDVGQVSLLESSFLAGPGKDETEPSAKGAASEPTSGLKSQAPVLSPVPDSQSVPPLRTPTPQAQGTTEPHDAASRQMSRTLDITPTEPLQPRRPDQSLPDHDPQPIQRESTLSTINSSPVKESDMLSDEIMRSLSPAGAAPTLDRIAESATKPGDPRGSSYTLSDYDSYWADGTEKPALEEGKDVDSVTAHPQNIAPGTHPTPPLGDAALPKESDASTSRGDNEPGLRRRFSWEASFEPNAKAPKDQSPVDEPSKGNATGTDTPGQPEIQLTKDVVPDDISARTETPKIVIPTGSEPSSAPPAQALPSMLEPGSPVSTAAEENAPHGTENRRPSLVDDKMLAESPVISATAQSDALDAQSIMSSTPTNKPGQMPQVMGLKEIMGLPTSTQRLNQYKESHDAFAVAELGLKSWIISLRAQHPEYANATASFGGVSYSTSPSTTNVASSSAPTQQPYYQQYLNATTPTATSQSSSRSRLGGLPLSTQAATSAFGNSSNQIGTKSKEFMHSAGKMGKGLFSKGKSKLRGTGDKVFH